MSLSHVRALQGLVPESLQMMNLEGLGATEPTVQVLKRGAVLEELRDWEQFLSDAAL